ncbi:hypothetical protein DRQ32_04615, partial [bacterium]
EHVIGTEGETHGNGLGDVNGDGHEDLGICAPVYNLSNGPGEPASFYLYLGGNIMDAAPDLSISHPASQTLLYGRSSTGGGDFNADGYDDMLVEVYSNESGALGFNGYMYFGGPVPDATVDLVFEGIRMNSGLNGNRASLAHDLNGDGFADLAAISDESPNPLHVYFGGPGADTVVDLQSGDFGAGYELITGDVTGDGQADLILAGAEILVLEGGAGFDLVPDRVLTWDQIHPSAVAARHLRLFRPVAGLSAPEILFDAYFDRNQVSLPATGLRQGIPSWGLPSPGLDITTTRVAVSNDLDGSGADELFLLGGQDLVLYDDLFFDCNEDGIPDNDQAVAGLLADCDQNGVADECETRTWPALDCNADFVPDSCQLPSLDCDDNGEIDSCEIDQFAWLDCDADGQLDSCVPVPPPFDRDANGLADCREIHEDSSLDCNGDGILDIVQTEDPSLDCDMNGWADFCEISVVPERDCNGDGALDICQVDLPGYDCNQNSIIDACEAPTESTADCNYDGLADLCQMQSEPDLDCDGNGFVDSCEHSTRTAPCAARPWIGVYFDAQLTVTQLALEDIPASGTVYVAVRGLDPGRVSSVDEYYFTLDLPSQLIVTGATPFPAGAENLVASNSEWAVQTNGPMSADAQGNLLLVEIDYLRLSPMTQDMAAQAMGTQLSPVSTTWASFVDAVSGNWRLLDSRLARFGSSLTDCNANGVDDLTDISSGDSLDLDGNGIPDECGAVAAPVPARRLELHRPVPNPFNPRTQIGFYLPEAASVRMVVHDASGRRVRILCQERLAAGDHERGWDGRDDAGRGTSSGVYYVRLESRGQVLTKKMVLLR